MAQASHGSVTDDLGIRIATGQLPPGSVLTLAGLEEQYGVSRTVIREAVRVLEAMGMLHSRRRVGVTVRPASEWSALDGRLIGWQLRGPGRDRQLVVANELRAAVEPIAARLSAQRATADERERIVGLAARLERLGAEGRGDSDEYLTADIAFHDLILDSSGNPMLAAVKPAVAAVITGRSRAGLTPGVPHSEALHNHVQTAAAIARGDAEAAEHHTRRYVEAVLGEVQVGD
ncbi:FCD domain-containing protein [Microbacterium sp. zg.Y625]|uniref:FadR/GntR family transcriptional regulator n=1 Tax=Microbacterium jiangjiandongii TaxID=3049071 RepID=UPI00214CAC1C|nr:MULTISPECIES: FCD domain-containing protein [unclassified Microbacterium]MCR2791521.1 FCD domain-containing protein [Microbacterium sp. zg.Y625]MCR2817026.1 FCD domain-containing protein [Microbacterium sp. zg.Y843]WIM24350.1 FCD domain-containing protein [Microbacterium sp. zg-Y625]